MPSGTYLILFSRLFYLGTDAKPEIDTHTRSSRRNSYFVLFLMTWTRVLLAIHSVPMVNK